MKQEKVAFLTLGCKVNQYETNAMAQKFKEQGYEVTEYEANDIKGKIETDIYVINTCTVTNISDRKSRQILRKVKEHNKKAIVVATGCYAQVAKEILEQMEEIDLVLGNNEKKDIVKYIEKFKEDYNKITKVEETFKSKEFCEFGTTTYTEKTRAAIKVQDGCDRFCTYCIIPYARGRVRSREPKRVIEEIKEIAQKGIKEVVITGIHIASYGKDFNAKYELIDLLEKINEIEGIKRIRLGSIEPTLITDEFIERLKRLKKVCHHFHLSLQSGCNETLARMNRKYSIEEFEKVVERLRNTYNDVILTTDIIVGFPGETEEEFRQTKKFLEEIKFYKMHIFPYSQRKGTKAAEMQKQVDGNIKEKRTKELIEISNKNQLEYNKKYCGKQVEVLIEEKEKGIYKGHTSNYILVKIKDIEDNNLENKIEKVQIEEANETNLIGKLLKN
ncbi:MAG: tRNA (N(6)-L-threonylcarbamoyladenosine(37)-C(2))-methylthiotransferase MtaB [Clostridia bacterium]|nr:tRNA (N(6)-L-threonylcarbamoyladenosine(37)-C(2))-methylthiotransferase MtaB [Clostridia bacterium]